MRLSELVATFGREGAGAPAPKTSPLLAAAGFGALLGIGTGTLHALARPIAGEGKATGREVGVHALIGATMGSLIGALSGRTAATIQEEDDVAR